MSELILTSRSSGFFEKPTFTVSPALSALLFRGTVRETETLLVRGLRRVYVPLVRAAGAILTEMADLSDVMAGTLRPWSPPPDHSP